MRADFGEDIIMSNEEAINYLKHNCRKMCQDCYPEIGRGGSENCDFCNEAGAYDTAIIALEKQIPHKPLDNINDWGVYCPNCSSNNGEILQIVGRKENGKIIPMFHYCPDCGTKIDFCEEIDNE